MKRGWQKGAVGEEGGESVLNTLWRPTLFTDITETRSGGKLMFMPHYEDIP